MINREIPGARFENYQGRSSFVNLGITGSIPEGNEADKYFTKVVLESNSRRRAIEKMILRVPDISSSWHHSIRREACPFEVLKKHRFLRRKGLPVVQTLRYDKKGDRFLLTCIVKEGEVVISNNRPLKKDEFPELDVRSLCYEVMKMMIESFDGGNGLALSFEAFLVIIPPEDLSASRVSILDIFVGSYLIEEWKSPHTSNQFNSKTVKEYMAYFIRKTGFLDRLSDEDVRELTGSAKVLFNLGNK